MTLCRKCFYLAGFLQLDKRKLSREESKLRQSVTECAASAATANLHATKPELSMAAEPLKTCTAYSMFYAAGQLYAHICISRIPVHACILGKPSNDLKSSTGPSMSLSKCLTRLISTGHVIMWSCHNYYCTCLL